MAKKEPIYSDIDVNLEMNPVTGDIIIKKDAEAVKQSVRLLLQTKYFNRLMQPYVGSSVYELLFKPLDNYYIELVKKEIQDLFKAFEPRVKILNIATHIEEQYSKVYIGIEYYIVNLDRTDTFVYAINRIR